MAKPCITLLFGAGASRFSGDCIPNYPPLGVDLQRELTREGYWPVDLPVDVLDEFARNFEAGMAMLSERYDSSQFIPLQREMGRYFARFQPGPKNWYRKLFERLPFDVVDMRIASLNYEVLIEHVVVSGGGGPTFVIKPHGSCGFLLNTSGIRIDNMRWKDVSSGNSQIQGPCDVVIDHACIEQWFADPAHSSFAPTMSLYAPGKVTQICGDKVEAERQRWRDAVSASELCIVVGVACTPEDQHIWDVLRDAGCRLVYVNPSDSGFASWNHGRKRPGRRWPLTFEQAITRIINACRRVAGRGPISL